MAMFTAFAQFMGGIAAQMAATNCMTLADFESQSAGRDCDLDVVALASAKAIILNRQQVQAAAEKVARAARVAKRDTRREERAFDRAFARANKMICSRQERKLAEEKAANEQVKALQNLQNEATCLKEMLGDDKFAEVFGKVWFRLRDLTRTWQKNCQILASAYNKREWALETHELAHKFYAIWRANLVDSNSQDFGMHHALSGFGAALKGANG